MRYLLDTNIIIWALSEDKRLKNNVFDVLRNPANELFCSAASVWEIAIKLSIGKLKMPENFLQVLEENSIDLLPVKAEHAYAVRDLPHIHNDPFDRLLIVQAQIEEMTIITHDKIIGEYSIPCIMV